MSYEITIKVEAPEDAQDVLYGLDVLHMDGKLEFPFSVSVTEVKDGKRINKANDYTNMHGNKPKRNGD